MSAFQIGYRPLAAGDPTFGEVARLQWDSEYFGFGAGTYRPDEGAGIPAAETLQSRLLSWMEEQQVDLLSCHARGDDFTGMARLGEAGFRFVDLSLLAHLRRLDRLPPARLAVRPADDAELEPLAELARTSFRFGRYHADPRFPRPLADDRYRRWVGNAMAARDRGEFVHVCGPVGAPTGFIHAKLDGAEADLRLAAVDAERGGGLTGPALFAGSLRLLAAAGARSARARLSAANTAVLNLYAGLGFAFHQPEAIYHLHAPGAKHLLPPR